MYVIGTAGHVDHGKSTLVQAISGINPDRLREEQLREMTIDLGFAWVTLPSGREISIVDVPGHEDFIKNMLAGVGGIDLALLVVAADEAVMPQTREHLAILDLLQVPRGLVALTKADLVDDPVWLELVAEEVREVLAGTALEGAPVVPVSVITGEGIETLLSAMDKALADATPRVDLGSPRLPIDRAFTISGFGTVVTGTLVGGTLHVGDTVEIVPGGTTARVRGLQSHQAKIETATPGSRVAVNLTGVDVGELARGQVITRPQMLTPTRLLDVELRVLTEAPWPVGHSMEVEVFTGSAAVLARTRILDAEELLPGDVGWAQLRLREPLAVSRYDRFVVRLPSPSVTLGGGRIIEPHPVRRHRRFSKSVTDRLQRLAQGSPEVVLAVLLDERGPMPARELLRQSELARADAVDGMIGLIERGEIVTPRSGETDADRLAHSDRLVVTATGWERLMRRATKLLDTYHRSHRLRPGMPREEFKTRLGVPGDLGNQVLDLAEEQGGLRVSGEAVALASYHVVLEPDEEAAVERIMARFEAEPFTPPGYPEVEEELGPELAEYLVASGRLVKASDSVVFTPQALDAMTRELRTHRAEHGQVTVAEVRDLFDTSRKYAVAFLEEMDRRRITKRIGDVRVLR